MDPPEAARTAVPEAEQRFPVGEEPPEREEPEPWLD
jgi:hypothetical protein